MNVSLRVLAILSVPLVLGTGSRAQTSLSKESPFMPAGNAGAAVAAGPGETIEFAGVMGEGKKTLVNIYDKQAKKGRWISVGETIDGFNVLSYDSRREQVVVKMGNEQKTLTLRKATGTLNAPTLVAFMPPAGFNTPSPTPPALAQTAAPPPAPAAATTPPAENPAPSAPAAAPGKPEAPPTPATIARQEEEARMLVSDLLEIGMAQRKAYEEKQRSAAAQQAGQAVPPAQPNKGG